MQKYVLSRAAFLPLFAIAALGVVSTPVVSAIEQGAKVVYLTAVDDKGVAVTDLTQSEVFLREGGQDRQVVAVRQATQPLYIQILADTTKESGAFGLFSSQSTIAGSSEVIRDIRVALSGFINTVAEASPESQMELMEFGQASITVTPMTSNVEDLQKGVNRLFPKRDAASVLLEAITESAKSLSKAPGPRRAIVILNIEPGDEQSRQDVKILGQELQNSGASVWAVSLQQGTNTNPQRGLVLETITNRSGGRREHIVGQSALIDQLKLFAENLTQQYAVSFIRPVGERPGPIQVGVSRQGLKLYANQVPPQ